MNNTIPNHNLQKSHKQFSIRYLSSMLIITLLQIVFVSLCAAAYPAAPSSQLQQQVEQKNEACVSCHTVSDSQTMHMNAKVKLACVDCHGGDISIIRDPELSPSSESYRELMNQAHVLPNIPGKPEAVNSESADHVRFINPSDYRVVRAACGACHLNTIKAAERSLMSTAAMILGGAAYNNGILPFKNYRLGDALSEDGRAAILEGALSDNPDLMAKQHGILPRLYPAPTTAFTNIKPAGEFRLYEQGGRNIINQFTETGLPNILGTQQSLNVPGKSDQRQSNRGIGTGASVAFPVINFSQRNMSSTLRLTRGAKRHRGGYRSTGCASCHVIYANNSNKKYSGVYAKNGNESMSYSKDPTVQKHQSGHPIAHTFTRAIPTSQCMSCHMTQASVLLNSFLGYTHGDYESEVQKSQQPNLDSSKASEKGTAQDFLENVSNIKLDSQEALFAEYGGLGRNYRAVFKRDRDGNLLDKENNIVAENDPQKYQLAVHMSSIHMDVGMHCVDCHFSQDNHGTGHVFGEIANAIQIDCIDCHGTADRYPNLKTSGPAAMAGSSSLALLHNADGQRRFEWVDGKLYQRSVMDPNLEWELSLVKDTVDSRHSDYNEKAARAKLMGKNKNLFWGNDVTPQMRAHRDEAMECYTCHSSWTTTCSGCHLVDSPNRNTASRAGTFNRQVVRDQTFMLGRRGEINGGKIAPIRSSSALLLSSVNANNEILVMQQAPISASGFSSQAFSPHFPHTVRKTETKRCSDCHLSKAGDNNAIMAQLFSHGTNFLNFIGYYAWLGGESSVDAVQVTEWGEPQAVIGSDLHRYAYSDRYKEHHLKQQKLQAGHSHVSGRTGCLQVRGEYLYSANGAAGSQIYDIANIANKAYSQRITTSPVGPWGQNTLIKSTNATCIALPTNQPIHPDRNKGELMRLVNQEQAFSEIYKYALITDSEEGLILVDVNTLADLEPRNNFLRRALTWNEDAILKGARHITLGGSTAYIIADAGLVILDLDKPLSPRLAAILPLNNGRASTLQFRYLWVTDKDGLKVIDVTDINSPKLLPNNTIPLRDAKKVYVARTYAYVASGKQGIAIIDVKSPQRMKLTMLYNANGGIVDARDIVVATTNASLIAYVADARGGLKVLQLTSPVSQPKLYGFSPAPKPELIATYKTSSPALSLSKGLVRDRSVDETGGQVAVFGRLGSRPLSKGDMARMYLDERGTPWFVEND